MNEQKLSPASSSSSSELPSSLAQPSQGRVQEMAKQVTQAAEVELQKLKSAVREQGSAAVEEIKTGAESATQKARVAGRDFLADQKANLAQKIGEYAEAMREASERLRRDEDTMLAGPVKKTADQLERMSTYLRQKEPAEFLDDLESFARRKPEVVFGGLFVIGLAAARFFKASRRRPSYPGGTFVEAGTSELSAGASSFAPMTNEPASPVTISPTAPPRSPSPRPTPTPSIP